MFWIASILVKFLYWIINSFKLGNGYTWPGHIVNEIFPNIWHSPSPNFKKGVILVSGTNGKTTTTKLIAHLIKDSGSSVASNLSGANLLNGLLTTIFLNTDLFGRINKDFAVFEVDELNLPLVLERLTPTHLVLTNLSRDQLDRYGEVDTILEKWKQAFTSLINTTLIINSEFEQKDSLLSDYPGPTFEFDSSPDHMEKTSLLGSFNSLNVNAAVLVAEKLEIDPLVIDSSLPTFVPAFGRGEKLSIEDINYYIFLAKNPASFNNNLKMVLREPLSYDAILFILNDRIPDGRDVSWIYDIEPDLLFESCQGKKVYVSGTRSSDMHIRLSYAGVPFVNELGELSESVLKDLPEKNTLLLPNYSAMLEFRKLVTGKNIL